MLAYSRKRFKVMLASHPGLYRLVYKSNAALRRLTRRDAVSLNREHIQRVSCIERDVQKIESESSTVKVPPVLFFNPSSHLTGFNLMAVAGLAATWGLRVAGQPVVYLVCHSGLNKCVLGTDQNVLNAPPPCESCIPFHNNLYPAQHTVTFAPSGGRLAGLRDDLASAGLKELIDFSDGGLPIGALCVPSVRWRLRVNSLDTASGARQLLAHYIVSAVGLAQEIGHLLDALRPRALLVFNGTFFPEAIARAVAIDRTVPVVTYEGGYLSDSVFFSHDVASEYRIDIPESFEMGPDENKTLDDYLTQRFQGNFAMVGTRFWPEMHALSGEVKAKMDDLGQVVTVFTNVVFDTSQTFANTVFKDMFDWLDEIMELVRTHPTTLFVVRAHPDELRQGKESQETVEHRMRDRGHMALPNVVFIPPTQYSSSYELIRQSRFCLVYNSTVGLEATTLGVPVVAGGRTRYSSESVAHMPESREAFRDLVASFLDGNLPAVPQSWQLNSRRYLYYSMFRAAPRLSDFVEFSRDLSPQGYAFKRIAAMDLHPDESEEMRIIYDGIVKGDSFHYR